LNTPIRSAGQRASSWLAWLQEKSFTLSGILIWVATALVTANVVGRYFLHSPLAWVIEVTQYILVWFTFLAMAWVLRSDRHIKVEVLTTHLPRRVQIILDLFSDWIGLIVTGTVTGFSAILVIRLYRTHMRETSLLEPLSWPLFLAIVAGSALTMLEFIRRIFKDCQSLRELPGKESK
jgi:C4-dicarboxylate transporter DctQ subunit